MVVELAARWCCWSDGGGCRRGRRCVRRGCGCGRTAGRLPCAMCAAFYFAVAVVAVVGRLWWWWCWLW